MNTIEIEKELENERLVINLNVNEKKNDNQNENDTENESDLCLHSVNLKEWKFKLETNNISTDKTIAYWIIPNGDLFGKIENYKDRKKLIDEENFDGFTVKNIKFF